MRGNEKRSGGKIEMAVLMKIVAIENWFLSMKALEIFMSN
jgi:aryl carrier-like protein